MHKKRGRGDLLQNLLDTPWDFDTKITVYSYKRMRVFDTRFTKCSCKNLPIIVVKEKSQEHIQTFTCCQKMWRGGMDYKIHQIIMKNFATSLCKKSRTHAKFYKLSKNWLRGAFDTKFTRY